MGGKERGKYTSTEEIASSLREWILGGRLKPLEKMPSRKEISTILRTTPNTAQSAFDELVADGLVTVRPRQGSYVAQYLPHLHNYSVLIQSHAESTGWVNFWSTIRSVAQELNSGTKYRVTLRTSIDKEYIGDEYRALVRDIKHHCVAGLIFLMDPAFLAGTPVMDSPWLPKVSLVPASSMPTFTINQMGFLVRALDFLKQRNRRRIGVITVPGYSDSVLSRVVSAAHERGLTCNERWIQAVDIHDVKWAGNLAWLMYEGAAREGKDGLIVMDDNLVDDVCRGIVKAGAYADGGLDIVAHANFPLQRKTLLPINRLGFDVRDIIDSCIARMVDQRNQRPVEDTIIVEPIFEDEFEKGERGGADGLAGSACSRRLK